VDLHHLALENQPAPETMFSVFPCVKTVPLLALV
jgi:hypothetical protein